MKRTELMLVCAALCLGLAGVASHSSANSVDISAGKLLAQENCARCHALAKGEKSKHDQAPSFHQIVTRYPPSSLAEALAEGISTGHPDMPEFVFEPDQISDLIAYLESLQ